MTLIICLAKGRKRINNPGLCKHIDFVDDLGLVLKEVILEKSELWVRPFSLVNKILAADGTTPDNFLMRRF